MSTFSGSYTCVLYWPKLAAGHASSSSPSSYPPLLLPASRHHQHSPKLCFGRNAPANYYTNINSDVKPSQFSSIVYGSPYNLVHKEHSKGEKKQELKTERTGFRFADK